MNIKDYMYVCFFLPHPFHNTAHDINVGYMVPWNHRVKASLFSMSMDYIKQKRWFYLHFMLFSQMHIYLCPQVLKRFDNRFISLILFFIYSCAIKQHATLIMIVSLAL